MAAERLQKILARAGIASRRHAEKLMLEGRVLVNGQVANRMGMLADPETDHIRVDGKLLRFEKTPRYYFLAFKPREMITSLSDPEGRPTIADLLEAHRIRTRVYPVGRLDWDADGLLLLTDDGDLAYRVMHPRTHLPKVYEIKVRGVPGDRALDRVRRGVTIEPGLRTLPAEVEILETNENASKIRVVLVEGRQNQIKKMFERVGHPVRRIRRTALGPLRLGRMKAGEVRPLTPREIQALRRAASFEDGKREGEGGTKPRSRRSRSRKP